MITRLELAARDAASMLRLLVLVSDLSGRGDAEARPKSTAGFQALREGADEVMRALDRLAELLPSGLAHEEAARQCWEVAPVPPGRATLERWATRWDAVAQGVAA
jgi:hypothetical protein